MGRREAARAAMRSSQGADLEASEEEVDIDAEIERELEEAAEDQDLEDEASEEEDEEDDDASEGEPEGSQPEKPGARRGYLDELREQYDEEEIRDLVESGRNAREMRRSAQGRYDEAARLREQAASADEYRAAMRLARTQGMETAQAAFPHLFEGDDGGAGFESDDDPTSALARRLDRMEQRDLQRERAEMFREAQRNIASVLEEPEFEPLRKLGSKVRGNVEQSLLQWISDPRNGVDTLNIRERVRGAAKHEQRDWLGSIQTNRSEYVQRKREAKKVNPPSGKGPRGSVASRPKGEVRKPKAGTRAYFEHLSRHAMATARRLAQE